MSRILLALLLAFSLIGTAAPARAAPSPNGAIQRAQAYESALNGDVRRLRKRHNIERLISLWRAAEKGANDAQRRLAVEGQARAWKLLAHWSGLEADRARARVLAGRVESAEQRARSEPKVKPAARAEKHEPSAQAANVKKPGPRRAGDGARAMLEELKQATAEIAADEDEGEDEEAEAEVEAPEPEPAPKRARSDAMVDRTARHLRRSTREATRSRTNDLVSIKRIVIDAGHGGRDRGAKGAGGVLEKDVNLAIAKKLGAELKRRLGVRVIYTRTGDQFLSLQRRAMIANAQEADLFVSIHANAHPKRSVHGIETYYLNTTADRYAARLAERENMGGAPEADTPEPGVGMPDDDAGSLPGGSLGRDLRLILADLAMRSASAESRRLAGHVQTSVITNLRRKQDSVSDLGVKHALFYVLLGARMPSILIETGFVTHPTEGRRLRDAEYQGQLASAIAQGITRWVSDRDAALRASSSDRPAQKIAAAEGRSRAH